MMILMMILLVFYIKCVNEFIAWVFDCACGVYMCVREISYSEPFSVTPWVAVDHRRRARTHPRPSWRDALSNDILRGPRRLRQSLRRCAANRLEVSVFISV